MTLNHALVGSAVGTQATFKNAIGAIIIGALILIFLGITYGLVGQRTGLGTGNLCRYSFGIRGSKIPTFFTTIALWGWLCFDMWTGAAIVSSLFPGGTSVPGFYLGAVIMASIAGIGAFIGIIGIKWISWTTVPIMTVLFVIIIITCINRGGGMEVIMAYKPPVEMPFFIVVNLALGCWINGTTVTNDMTRMAKNSKAVIAAIPVGIGVAAVLLIMGTVGWIGLGAFGIAALGFALGGSLFYITAIFSMIAMGNTVPASNYVCSQGLVNIFNRNRKPFCFIIPIVAIGVAGIIEFVIGIESISQFVGILATFMPPIMGVVLVDYWFINKGSYPALESLTRNFNPSGIISFFVGSGVAFIFTFVYPFGLPAIFGIVTTGVLMYILKKGLGMK